MTQEFSFVVHSTDGAARKGEITTPRGKIRTPAFMPVGTAATVKAMFAQDVRAAGADILLGNVYHLMLRPAPSASPGSAGCTSSCAGPIRS